MSVSWGTSGRQTIENVPSPTSLWCNTIRLTTKHAIKQVPTHTHTETQRIKITKPTDNLQ